MQLSLIASDPRPSPRSIPVSSGCPRFCTAGLLKEGGLSGLRCATRERSDSEGQVPTLTTADLLALPQHSWHSPHTIWRSSCVMLFHDDSAA